MEVTSGYLIEMTFERMYREYIKSFSKERFKKEFPDARPVPLEQMHGKYRGIGRVPLEPWSEKLERFRGDDLFNEPSENEVDAAIFMQELEDSGKSEVGLIFSLEDAVKIFEMITPPVEREIIWVRRMDKNDKPPTNTIVLGYEPIWCYENSWSPVLDNDAFFRYYHVFDPEDPDESIAKSHFARLNKNGLFDTPENAQEYADTFSSVPEDEQPKHIVEIRGF